MSTRLKEDKQPDRRARKTRRLLSDALIQLILEKRYDSITIQDVIDRADVGRSTFYAHFRDKDDLFLSGWEQLLDAFVAHIRWSEAGSSLFIPVEGLFAHIKDFHRFYLALVKSRKTDLIFKTGLEYMSKAIEDSLAAFLEEQAPPSTPPPVIASYIAAEVFGLLRWWVDHNMPYSPRRMSQMFHHLVVPGLLCGLSESAAGIGKSEPSLTRGGNVREPSSHTAHSHFHGSHTHKKIS